MQHRDDHLDEGTIHAWLDGALGADEARAVEAHVAGCASCAAAVAEARGLIAAASGILAKLDAVPAGVVPRTSSPAPLPPRDADAAAVPIGVARRERQRAPWWSSRSLRVAAALLVVATGTAVVVREQGTSRERAESVVGFSVNRSPAQGAQTTATAAAPAVAPAVAPPAPRPLTAPGPTPEREVASAPPIADTTAVAAAAPTARPAPPPRTSRAEAPPAAPAPVAPPMAPPAVIGSVAGGAGGASTDSSAPRAQSLAARDARDAPEARIGERSAKAANEGARQLARRRGAEAPAALAARAAAPTVTSIAGRAAGCYELQSARWTPAEPRLAVPERLALDTAPARTSESAREVGFVARAIGPAAAAGRTGHWTPLTGDSLRVVWSEGATGVELRASLLGDTLRGRAATFSDDARRAVQRVALTATRTACTPR